MIRGSIVAATEILAASGTMFHPSCTCAIGRTDDPMAVVDPECRVYGVAGLRVADASVMPSARRQHQFPDHHDRRARRRLHPRRTRIMLNGGKAQPAALSNANLPRPAILVKPPLLL
jgi:hypothetical protein